MKKVLAAVLALLLACAALAEEIHLYDEIVMSDTLETLSARYGEIVPDEEGMAALDGVICAFYESGRLRAKARDYESVREAAMLTESDFAPVQKLRQGEKLESVQALLGGEGTEILRLNLSDDENPGLQRVLAWKHADGRVIEVMFELDDGEWVLFAAVEIAGN